MVRLVRLDSGVAAEYLPAHLTVLLASSITIARVRRATWVDLQRGLRKLVRRG
jgi:hypothetical protein